jgi:carnitine 3-dehydrogenase
VGQARLGESVEVRTRVLAADAKRLHLFHDMSSVAQQATIATAEHMLIHVDTEAGASAVAPDEVLAKAQALVELQALLPPADGQGGHIRMLG